MQPAQNAQIFIIDDDAGVREALAWLLRSRRLTSQCFESADAFVAQWQPNWLPDQPSCMLLDVRMPGMSGLALFEWLIERDLLSVCPVIFLTGHADIPTAVDSVKRGAFDFCEKPFSDNALVDRIELALQRSAEVLEKERARKTVQARLDDLTERERDVMRLVVEGLPNKLIADQLDISVRTVEVHRARVFDKMAVKSAVELANLLRGADKEN
jgi:two-component system response regulator DctR